MNDNRKRYEMLPEVEKFFTTYNDNSPMTPEEISESLDNAYADLRKTIQENGNNNYYAMRKFEKAVDETTSKNHAGRRTKAWTALAAETEDAMVKYIAGGEHYLRNDYPDYLMSLLKLLPASLEELDNFANENGWCSDYDNYVMRAQRSGHLPADGFVGDSEARKELRAFFAEISVRRVNVRKLFSLVDKIVAEAVADKESVNDCDTDTEAPTTA